MAHDKSLPVNASRDDVEAYLRKNFEGSDYEVTKDDVDNTLRALQQQNSYRQSLDPVAQVQQANVPGIHPPHDHENPPAGVTVVDKGRVQEKSQENDY